MNASEPSGPLPRATGWRLKASTPSLPEVHRSIAVPRDMSFWGKMLAFSGPGFLVAVGYMDPGNWATDLAGGSQFGYSLLSVVLAANLMAILLQSLAAKLGIVTGRDLAQACRDHYSQPTVVLLWLFCEIAIGACDLAEVLGSAIALKLLFGLPLFWGVCVTALDVLAVMYLQNKGFRWIEILVVTLILTIGACFLAELVFAQPDLGNAFRALAPTREILTNREMLYIAIGILGATVMPHNLYLHSSIVQTRKYEQNTDGKAEAIKFATLDSTGALMVACFINAAILIVSAATFHVPGRPAVAEIEQAYQLLSPTLGIPMASLLFALALLASGQNSTLTGTLAGQIVMEGFLNIRLRPWLRRLITRLLAILPAIICLGIMGDQAAGRLIVFSQVILSMQLAFAVVPLVRFTGNRLMMGPFVNPAWLQLLAWVTSVIIILLNVKLLLDTWGLTQWLMNGRHQSP